MKRRKFLKGLGIGATASVLAPSILSNDSQNKTTPKMEGSKLIRPQGIDVYVSPLLPVHETTAASCIETKEPVELLTGKMIHCYSFAGTIMVSQELYNQIKEI